LESREGDNLAVKVNGAVTIRATFLNAFLAYVSSDLLFLTKERLNNAALENSIRGHPKFEDACALGNQEFEIAQVLTVKEGGALSPLRALRRRCVGPATNFLLTRRQWCRLQLRTSVRLLVSATLISHPLDADDGRVIESGNLSVAIQAWVVSLGVA
jgi:hypothetical protein